MLANVSQLGVTLALKTLRHVHIVDMLGGSVSVVVCGTWTALGFDKIKTKN